MKENETITASEIVDRLELSVRTIKRDIEYLKVMKIVRCEDTAKYGKWIISE